MNMPINISIRKAMNDKLTVVEIEEISLYFSYEQLIAVTHFGVGTVVRKNVWNNTTARHLKYVDGATKEALAARLDEEEFNDEVEAMLASTALDIASAVKVGL